MIAVCEEHFPLIELKEMFTRFMCSVTLLTLLRQTSLRWHRSKTSAPVDHQIPRPQMCSYGSEQYGGQLQSPIPTGHKDK